MMKTLDYIRRKWQQDLRDMVFGHNYVLDGQNFLVPKSASLVARRAIQKGLYEWPERLLVSKFLPKDLTVLELGGSYGIVSNIIRRHIDIDVRQIVVEANSDLIPICAHNVSLAGVTENTYLLSAALGYSESGFLQFDLGSGHHSSRLVCPNKFSSEAREVPVITMSSLVDKYTEGACFSLVCDIEGAELEMLRRDGDALKKCKCLILETHPSVFSEMGSSIEEAEALISAAGLKIVAREQDVLVAIRG
jgi:FkbM family methyltransferase